VGTPDRRLAAAGYRVVAWSRRDYIGTQVTGDDPGVNADIPTITKALGLGRFHGRLGSRGGIAVEFATAHPDRLLSLTMANSISGLSDPAFRAWAESLRPAPFGQLPQAVRELGPTYRAANPEGRAAGQSWRRNRGSSRWARRLRRMWDGMIWPDWPMPILWMTGDADLFVPPPLQKRPGATRATAAMPSCPVRAIRAIGKRPKPSTGPCWLSLRRPG
jgi:pimeloyl-ACP methyl ester carboxylesterase